MAVCRENVCRSMRWDIKILAVYKRSYGMCREDVCHCARRLYQDIFCIQKRFWPVSRECMPQCEKVYQDTSSIQKKSWPVYPLWSNNWIIIIIWLFIMTAESWTSCVYKMERFLIFRKKNYQDTCILIVTCLLINALINLHINCLISFSNSSPNRLYSRERNELCRCLQ